MVVVWLDSVKVLSHQPQYSISWNTRVHASNVSEERNVLRSQTFIDDTQ